MDTNVKNLKVYTSSLEELNVPKIERESKFLGAGCLGFAYLTKDNKVIKLLDRPGTRRQYELLSFIKNLELPNAYHIHDVLSNKKNGIKSYGGIIYEYINKEKVNLWEMPSSFIVENFKKLFAQAIILGHNCVLIDDLHIGNIIVNHDSITTIDFDEYYFDLKNVTSSNIEKMRQVLMDLLIFNYLVYNNEKDKNKDLITNNLKKVKSLGEFSNYRNLNNWLKKAN